MTPLLLQRGLARRGLAAAQTQLHRQARCFSSSSGGDSPQPQFERGFASMYNLSSRCIERMPKFLEYQKSGVFMSQQTAFGQLLLFLQLQMPVSVEIDAQEFLEGAKQAIDAELRAVNSVGFQQHLVGEEDGDAEVVESMKQYCTPAYYNKLALNVNRLYGKSHAYFECEGMTVESANLVHANYNRMTTQQYEDEVAFKKPPPDLWPIEATVERMQLHVQMATVEDLRVVSSRVADRFVQQQNVYHVVFESRVTSPEEIAWRIDDVNVIEQRTLSRPGNDQAPSPQNEEKTA